MVRIANEKILFITSFLVGLPVLNATFCVKFFFNILGAALAAVAVSVAQHHTKKILTNVKITSLWIKLKSKIFSKEKELE